mmetsp:Transcript_9451/g.41397  ORF Transcript_9451/g.41397 Transcript_9451/m.41397 type:complete len:206 (-) Transcript_9451:223-840(-)
MYNLGDTCTTLRECSSFGRAAVLAIHKRQIQAAAGCARRVHPSRRDSSVRLKICTSPGGVHARAREIPIPRLPSVLLVHERVHVALAHRALHAVLEPPVHATRVVRVQAREVAQRLTLGVVLEADGASRVVLARRRRRRRRRSIAPLAARHPPERRSGDPPSLDDVVQREQPLVVILGEVPVGHHERDELRAVRRRLPRGVDGPV